MEPNTGITFADVAGVEEAKADFMEVGFNVTQYGSVIRGFHQSLLLTVVQ